MKKRIVLLAVLVFSIAWVYGNNDGRKPRWLSEVPVASNSTFEYKVITVYAQTASEAKGLVPQEITNYVETTQKVQITSVSKMSSEVHNGNVSEETSFNMMALVEGDPVNVVVKIIDEYHEAKDSQGVYFFLCAVGNPKASSVNFDRVQITDKYGVKGFWRSAILPGWGQMYKGSMGKGIAILGAEVVAAGGIVALESMRSSYVTKAKTQPHYAQQYYSKASNCGNIRNGFILAAGAIYIYNLVDAIVAPGSRWVKTTNGEFAFYPTVTTEGMGLTVAYHF
jgi:hypothetical protein